MQSNEETIHVLIPIFPKEDAHTARDHWAIIAQAAKEKCMNCKGEKFIAKREGTDRTPCPVCLSDGEPSGQWLGMLSVECPCIEYIMHDESNYYLCLPCNWCNNNGEHSQCIHCPGDGRAQILTSEALDSAALYLGAINGSWNGLVVNTMGTPTGIPFEYAYEFPESEYKGAGETIFEAQAAAFASILCQHNLKTEKEK
jgi:hypothetical protein